MIRRLLTVSFVAIAFLLLTSSPAQADSITYNLSQCNPQLCGAASGPYGTVGLVLNGNGSITVTFTAASTYGFFDTLGFNIVGSTTGLSITGITAGWSTPKVGQEAGNVDGFGGFEWRLSGPTGSNPTSSVVFTVARTGGFTTVLDLVEPSSGSCGNCPPPVNFAVHVQPGGGALTGYAGAPLNTTPVPEPGTLALFGSGLLGMAGVIRRRLNL
jgi:hypothetical protein